MNETSADPLAGVSTLLWATALLIALLASYVAIGYVRQRERETQAYGRWICLVASTVSLGSGIVAAMLLAVSSDGTAYPLGYQLVGLVGVWVFATATSGAAIWLLGRWRATGSAVVAGLVVSAGAVGAGVLLILSAGLYPGPRWQAETLALALPLTASGCIAGFWLAFLGAGRRGRWRRAWRAVAAGMVGIAIIVGHQLLLASAGMGAQVSSAYRTEVPAPALALLAGIAVPLALLVLLLDLRMRRVVRDPNAPPPRKRHRVRRGRSIDG
jgi:NO-binding membrane sensor protein with MHYT domain